MAVTTGTIVFYAEFFDLLGEGVIDLGSDAIRLLLTTLTYNPTGDPHVTHTILTDVTNELTGNGYARQLLGTQTWDRSGGGTSTFDAVDPVFTASGGSIVARRYVLFDDTPATPLDPLIITGLLNSADADVTVTDTNTLTWEINASGIFTLTGT